eukprot:1190682-Prorocentrum_minimum.AAC.2
MPPCTRTIPHPTRTGLHRPSNNTPNNPPGKGALTLFRLYGLFGLRASPQRDIMAAGSQTPAAQRGACTAAHPPARAGYSSSDCSDCSDCLRWRTCLRARLSWPRAPPPPPWRGRRRRRAPPASPRGSDLPPPAPAPSGPPAAASPSPASPTRAAAPAEQS